MVGLINEFTDCIECGKIRKIMRKDKGEMMDDDSAL